MFVSSSSKCTEAATLRPEVGSYVVPEQVDAKTAMYAQDWIDQSTLRVMTMNASHAYYDPKIREAFGNESTRLSAVRLVDMFGSNR